MLLSRCKACGDHVRFFVSLTRTYHRPQGGAVHLHGGANSYPLRGGYMNNWEGGIRVAALVNGGFLPDHVRGQTLGGFIHEADWYATFCRLPVR